MIGRLRFRRKGKSEKEERLADIDINCTGVCRDRELKARRGTRIDINTQNTHFYEDRGIMRDRLSELVSVSTKLKFLKF